MRLIRVSVVLNVEEGKKVDPEIDVLKDFSDDELEETTYAILSHCWDEDKEEVQFKEMQGLTRITGPARQVLRKRRGYQKIVKSCELAHKDGLDWVWVDTCCINKESSSELTEAINSMFRWYSNAKMCYTYLHDVQASCFPTEHDVDNFPNFNGWPKWFSRGWTLQELVAPDTLLFFNREWQPIGNKRCLADTLEQITCIPSRVLAYGMDSYRPSIAQVMSWAADRRTKRVEDRAYSLLGLFGVHMPMLYGEGKNAFRRLQLELIRFTNDHSIFAWDRQHAGWSGSVLADDPSFFRDCDDIVKMEPNEYLAALKGANPDEELHAIPQEPPRTYSVTNAGIQISLPLKRCRGFQSVFEARLACRHSPDSSPISIVLASFQSTYYRAFGDFEPMLGTTAQFQPLYLAYREEKRRSDFTFKFDDSAVSCDGFVQRCIFPDRVMSNDNSITLRNTNDRAIIVYAKDSVNTCFAVAVGYSLGHEWVHVVCDDPLEESNPSTWKAYAEQVYKRMWTASPEHAQRMAQAWQTATFERHSSVFHLVQHAHLPQSLSGVRIVCKQLPQPQMGLVTIDVVRCTGCCIAPGVWQTLNGFSSNGLDTPGLMIDGAATRGAVHRLLVDAVPTPFTSSLGEPGIKVCK
ncbi:heterokaryon incompatibility protein-domain-containing protein [Scleroderma yunnanense]